MGVIEPSPSSNLRFATEDLRYWYIIISKFEVKVCLQYLQASTKRIFSMTQWNSILIIRTIIATRTAFKVVVLSGSIEHSTLSQLRPHALKQTDETQIKSMCTSGYLCDYILNVIQS